MTSDDANNKGVRGIGEMTFADAWLAVVRYMLPASSNSCFYIGFFFALVVGWGFVFLQFKNNNIYDFLENAGIPILAVLYGFFIGMCGILIGTVVSFPALLVGSAYWILLHRRGVRGIYQLIGTGAFASLAGAEILFPIKALVAGAGPLYELAFLLGGIITPLVAYSDLRKIDAVEDIFADKKASLYPVRYSIGFFQRITYPVVKLCLAFYAMGYILVLLRYLYLLWFVH